MKTNFAILFATSALMPATPLLAQQSSTSESNAQPQADQEEDSSANATGAIQEIVVTARRREESLQDTPVTVTAFSNEELNARGINDIRTLVQATPGVSFDAFPRAAPRPFFRGIGSSNQGAGGDPSSVAFLDGVYLGRAAMLGIDFYDMARIEVLKGPQGTLFGKNVVGGAVNFITAKPVNFAEAAAELTFGQYEQLDGHFMLNVPVSEAIATRLVLGAITNGGFRQTLDGRNLDDENKLSARFQTTIGFGGETTLLLSGDYARQDIAQGARYNVRILPFNATGDNRGFDDFDEPRIANPDRLGGIDTDTGGVRAELNSDFLGFATLTATAAWRALDFSSFEDFDGTTAAQNAANGVPLSGIQVIQAEDADSYSAETRLASLNQNPLSWVFGLYYNNDDITRVRESQTSLNPQTINEFTGFANNRSYAAFGEAEYKFSFGFGIFAGARYTDEKKEYEVFRLTGPRAAPVVAYSTVGTPGISREKEVTYRFGADYRFNPNLYVYGSVSTGFKSGAFQEQPSGPDIARLPTDPEKVTNYELGIKTDFLSRRLRFNITGFIADYTDLQTIQSIPDATLGPGGSRIVTDTGDATIEGIETEFIFAPVAWVDLTARYAYLDAKFDSLIQTSAIQANGQPVFSDLAGNRLSRTPKHALNAALGFTSSRTSWGWMRAMVVADYRSEIFDDNDNDFVEYRRPRTLWDASITYHLNDRFSAQAWVRNFTDVEYRTHQTDVAGGVFVQYGPPRQFGVTLSAEF
ncbi:TonB-dependent receptor [Novosphingopyxis sp.]|uniref:TonB-dependent receptor n=1 Tax=Novosphingopyxis sp. TaxID=2709690 RepID=UPI003B5C71DC